MKIQVLFVCMGNICRSPAAQGVFERLVLEQELTHAIEIDSAGTHAYHVGEAPDRRMQMAAGRRGLDLSTQRARQVQSTDFEHFDYILAMDQANLSELRKYDVAEADRPILFMSFAEDTEVDEVPDPYYGGELGFERVLDLVEAAAQGLLREIRDKHGI